MAARELAPAPPESGLAPVPGDPGLPLVGYSWQLMHDPLGIGRRRYDMYGPVSWLNAFGTRMVALLGPDAAEAALANRDRAFSSGEGWGYFIGPFFRRGIMLLDFDEHLRHRRIMQQAFTRARFHPLRPGRYRLCAVGCTSASGCISPVCRSRRCCISYCCVTGGAPLPATRPRETTPRCPLRRTGSPSG
jgi:hypothetical protein